MSTADQATRARRTPGLVPVAETLSTAERLPPQPPAPPPPPVARPVSAFWRLLRSELGLTFRRPRNLIMLGVLAIVPVVFGVSLWLYTGDGDIGGMIAAVTGNSLMLTFAAFSAMVLLMMPMAVSEQTVGKKSADRANLRKRVFCETRRAARRETPI